MGAMVLGAETTVGSAVFSGVGMLSQLLGGGVTYGLLMGSAFYVPPIAAGLAIYYVAGKASKAAPTLETVPKGLDDVIFY